MYCSILAWIRAEQRRVKSTVFLARSHVTRKQASEKQVSFESAYRLHSSDLEFGCGSVQLLLGQVALVVDVAEEVSGFAV